MADRMAVAMAEGRLEEFLQQELSDSEHAKALAAMMLGMTGMMPPGTPSPAASENKGKVSAEGKDAAQESRTSTQPPEDLTNAAHAGDVKSLVELLRREHERLNPDAESLAPEESGAGSAGQPAIGRDTIDQLLKIASDNNLTVDWLIMRAVSLYVQDYLKTGRL